MQTVLTITDTGRYSPLWAVPFPRQGVRLCQTQEQPTGSKGASLLSALDYACGEKLSNSQHCDFPLEYEFLLRIVHKPNKLSSPEVPFGQGALSQQQG